MIKAEVIQNNEGLTIQFTATGADESRIRQMFDRIDGRTKDGKSDISNDMGIVLDIAVDAVNFIDKNQAYLW